MAAIVVTTENTRVEDAEATTGYSNIGGGPGGAAEASFAYQGSFLFNRKITSATGGGFFYDPTADGGSAQDMTTVAKAHWMVKIMVSDYGGLDATDGVRIRIGSDGSNYDVYVLAGSDSPLAVMSEYRPVGGLLVFPVTANESTAYSDSVKSTGTPVLTAVDYFAAVYAFTTSTAKNENCGLDAIDLGTGLFMVGGDGADADGLYDDFVSFDEGTVNNRYGYARNADGGGILAFGDWRIGENSGGTVATVFDDSVAVITWLDGMFAAGFSKITANLGNATTDITDGCLHIGTGSTTTVDTRPDYIVENTAGTFLFTGTIRNFRNVTMTSAATVNGEIECELLTQATSDVENAIIKTNAITSVACLQDPTFGVSTGLNNTAFIQTGVGHAVEIATVGNYTFTELTWTGYGITTADDAALDLTATTGTYSLTINGGTTPTYKTAGATVEFVNFKTLTIAVVDTQASAIPYAKVRIENASTQVLIATGIANNLGVFVFSTYTYTTDENVDIVVRKNSPGEIRYAPARQPATIISTGLDATVSLSSDSIAGQIAGVGILRHGITSEDESGDAIVLSDVDVPDGTSRKLVVGAFYWDSSTNLTVSTATYDGSNMTNIAGGSAFEQEGAGNFHEIALYYIDVPDADTGRKDISITFSANVSIKAIGFAFIDDVATGAADNAASNTGDQVITNPSVSLNNSAAAWSVVFSMVDDVDSPTPTGVAVLRRSDLSVDELKMLAVMTTDRTTTGAHSLGVDYGANSKTWVAGGATFLKN